MQYAIRRSCKKIPLLSSSIQAANQNNHNKLRDLHTLAHASLLLEKCIFPHIMWQQKRCYWKFSNPLIHGGKIYFYFCIFQWVSYNISSKRIQTFGEFQKDDKVIILQNLAVTNSHIKAFYFFKTSNDSACKIQDTRLSANIYRIRYGIILIFQVKPFEIPGEHISPHSPAQLSLYPHLGMCPLMMQ